MRRAALAVALASLVSAALLSAQSALRLDPAKLLAPPTDSWPTYNGDYSGRRFSPLRKITTANVHNLSLAWMSRISTGTGTAPAIKATPLQVNGVLYFSVPDHVWAVDARTGRQLWQYSWKSRGGLHIGNRGVGIYEDWLYFETPDCHLVSLNLKDGTERWRKSICELDLFYYATTAPVVIKNHVIAGVSGDDIDVPGYIQSHDPESGELQWRWYVVPQKKGDPGSESWPNEEAARHGGGMTWQPVTYDPESNLIFVATGNPQPVVAHKNREGSNLFTGSIVALDVDTGKMKWHFQASPHDTHDWDATQTPVLFEGTIDGQPRKLVAQASRNGKFFVLDRLTGKALVSTDYANTNWALGFNPRGEPIPNPAKEPQVAGSLVSPNQGGATNWQAPSFSPQTGLFYVSGFRSYSIWYIYDDSDNPQGWGGTDRGGYVEPVVRAIDYRTGQVKWSRTWEGVVPRFGLLSTAGDVLFTAGPVQDLLALDARTGASLWNARLNAQPSNGPISYELDGRQYVVTGAGDALWCFVLNEPAQQR